MKIEERPDWEHATDPSERRPCPSCGHDAKRIGHPFTFKHGRKYRMGEDWTCLNPKCGTSFAWLYEQDTGDVYRRPSPNGWEFPNKNTDTQTP